MTADVKVESTPLKLCGEGLLGSMFADSETAVQGGSARQIP